jgi:streptogramin lyase
MNQRKQVAWRWAIVTIVVVMSGLALQAGLSLAAGVPGDLAPRSMVATGSSFIYRFDPVAQTFMTIPLPIGSIPMHAVVTGTAPTHVWLTEHGRNQIGHLVFTNTNSFAWTEYPVTSTTNSGPYRIAISGNSVWFTERGANRIGRLNTSTGVIDEFYGNGLSPDGNLADIKVAPNGRVWIAAPGSKRVVQLVVTSTLAYAFREYTDTLRPTNILVPEYLAVASNDLIWITNPQGGAASRVVNFQPSVPLFTNATSLNLVTPIDPREIVVTAGNVWYTNLGNNTLDQIDTGTNPILNHRVAVSSPAALASAGGSTFWLTQQTRPAVISRAIYTNSSSTSSVATYAMPIAELMLTSVAVAADGKVWVTAFQPNQIFLPLLSKN